MHPVASADNTDTKMCRWNFTFPTKAEKMTWRVCSLVATAMACFIYLVGEAPIYISWLASKIGTRRLKSYDPAAPITTLETCLSLGALLVYSIARLGLIALMFSSLRALPTGSYVSIDWLATIPHI